MKRVSTWGIVLLWPLTACANLPQVRTTKDTLSPAEHVTLGNTYAAKGEKDLATPQYQAALDEDKRNVPALMALGNAAYGNQDWRGAQTYFQRVLKVAPGNPMASNNLAMVYLAENTHLKEARTLVDSAMGVAGPLIPYLQDTLANIAIRENRWTDAMQALQRAQGTAPINDPAFALELQKTNNRLNDALKTHPPNF